MGRIWDKCFSPCSSGETLEISSHGEASNASPNEEQEVTLTSTEATLLNTPSKMEEEQQKQLQHIHLTLGPPEKDKKKSKKVNDVKDETFIKVKGSKGPATSLAKTSAFIVASSVYGQLLVVICLALFTARTTTSNIPLIYFDGFYLYLYGIGLLFLFYVFVYLLHDTPPENKTREGSIRKNRGKVAETEKSHGSIFLRIGAIVFGLGTMIYNGLEFGAYFESTRDESSCYSILGGINPILQATFTFAQMYFIFTFSRLMIHKFKLLARIGLMHLVAANLCTWIRIVGTETATEMRVVFGVNATRIMVTRNATTGTNVTIAVPTLCQRNDSVIGGVLTSSALYLFPFIVEYSLIGAAFLYIMWCNIGRRFVYPSAIPINGNTTSKLSPSGNQDAEGRNSLNNHHALHSLSPGRFSSEDLSSTSSRTVSTHSLYSCLESSKGLFTGFLFLVGSITTLIIFYVMINHPVHYRLATVIFEVSHSVLLAISIFATLGAYFKVRRLRFLPGLNETPDSGLRDLLMRVAGFGLYIHSLFGVIAGAMDPASFQNMTVLITSVLTIVQVTLQSLFISDVVCRRRVTPNQPGRQLIAFLMVTNANLWAIYTFGVQRVDASPVQMDVFGLPTWALIVRLTLPLIIFYRVHSTITFAEIWKNSYKNYLE